MINGTRLNEHIQKLAQIGKNPKGGVSRIAYSSLDKEGRTYVLGLMKEAGLKTSIDAAGNLIGSQEGSDTSLMPIGMGSHIDTVPEGGNYDGIAGSLTAIEVIQTLNEKKIKTRHPLRVMIFQNEEGGHLGSRAITSGLTEHDLSLMSLSKKTIAEGIRFIGGNPEKLEAAKISKGDLAAYLELHVEQGGILEKNRKTIGVVEGIVGIRRWNVAFQGFANHAGTTPMKMRKDALLAAARFIDVVYKTVTTISGRQVATVGQIEAKPGAPNVIPGEVKLTVETRDLETKKIDKITEKLFSEADRISRETQTTVKFEKTYDTPPVLANADLKNAIRESAKELKLTVMDLPSGAGHDAQELEKISAMGMIFIPSMGGISHSPEEFTKEEDLEAGANVFLKALERVDLL